jgi:hypothetical protein
MRMQEQKRKMLADEQRKLAGPWRIKSPFQFPCFALELAGIRRPVVQIRRLERDDLVQL